MHRQQGFLVRRTMAVVALSLLIVMAAQQACAAPVQAHDDAVQSSSSQSLDTPRRVARMTPLWRIMTKPLNAYCKENMECSTSVCRNGFCRSVTEAAKPAKS